MTQQVSDERFKQFLDISRKYYTWDIILRDANITQVSDKGDQYEIACPFHDDWSPSMRLTKSNGVYHCFSCGRKGTYTKFLWELAGKSVPYTVYCNQILSSNISMQRALGFKSLYINEKTLDPAFNARRTFNMKSHLGAELPISTLATKLRKLDDSWETLVISLSLLQSEVKTDNILSAITKKYQEVPKVKVTEEKTDLNELLFN